MKNHNNYAFIDGQNLHETVKKFNWYFCYKRFSEILKNFYGVSKAFYFIGYTQSRNCRLYRSLRNAGFHLSLRKPIIDDNNQIKANVDSNLITHALAKINKYNKAIIVAGDSDYYFLVKYLIRQNKLLKILLPSRNDSSNQYRSPILLNKIAYIENMKKYF